MPNVGERVLAEWPAEVDWWYPGVICASNGAEVEVQFDDGDRAVIAAHQARPLIVWIGARVYGRYEGGPYYYAGVVSAINGEAIHIDYDDGDKEWTTISMVRFHRTDLPSVH